MNSSVWAVWAAQGSKEKKVDLSFTYIFQILRNLILLDKEEILPSDDFINRQLSGKNLRKTGA